MIKMINNSIAYEIIYSITLKLFNLVLGTIGMSQDAPEFEKVAELYPKITF